MLYPYKNNGIRFVGVIVLLISSVYTMPAQARDRNFDLYLQPHYTSSKNIISAGGSGIDFDSAWGIGFGVGYNFGNHWAFNFEVAWGDTNYSAMTIDDNNNPTRYSGTMETSSTTFTGIYNFSRRAFTPYVSGKFGWVYINTDIPSGPPGSSCWWDPWYGYTCSEFIPTYNDTSLTYGAGLGLRFDVSDGMFIRASYNKDWIELRGASADDFDVVRFDIGTMLK